MMLASKGVKYLGAGIRSMLSYFPVAWFIFKSAGFPSKTHPASIKS